MFGAKSFGEKFAAKMREHAAAYKAEATSGKRDRDTTLMFYAVATTLEVIAAITLEVTA